MTPLWQLRRQRLVPWLALIPFLPRWLPDRWIVLLVGGLPIVPVADLLAYSARRCLTHRTARQLAPFFGSPMACAPDRSPGRSFLPHVNGLLDGSLAGWLVGSFEWTTRCSL